VRAYLHSQQDVVPEILHMLRAAKERAGIEEKISFQPLPDSPPRNVPVLSLGPMQERLFNHTVTAPSVAALMSKPDSISRLSDALNLLAGGISLPEMEWQLCEDVDDVRKLLEAYTMRGDPVVLDIETSGVADEDVPEYERVISIGLYSGVGRCWVIPEFLIPLVQTFIQKFLRNSFVIVHNEKFDLPYFGLFDLPVEQRFDPMVAHYVLYPAAGTHGLKELCEQYFGVGDWDAALKEYTKAKTYKEAGTGENGVWWDARKYPGGSGYERIPRSLLYKYNAYDVFYTYHLYMLLRKQLDVGNKWPVFARRMNVSGMFMQIEEDRFTIDRKHLENLKVQLEQEFRDTKERLDVVAGYPINPNSPKQVKDWFSERGMELPRLRSKDAKTGRIKVQPSSSEKALNLVIENAKGKYDGDAIEFAEILLELRGITKNLGTYVNGFLDRAHGNTIRPTFNVTGPMTGRIANRGAGILTIPRDPEYRKMVIPSGPDRVLVKPDYGQIEMRLVSFFSKDKRFVAAFQPGMPDFFTQMMPQVYPDVDLTKLTKAEHKELRNGVKPISHGANYNRGVAAIAEQLGMPVAQAIEIYERYMGPHGEGLRAWQAMRKEQATQGEDIVTAYGWHFQAEVILDKNANSIENSALAFEPQSTANDICLGAAMRIQPQLKQYNAWLIATVHDQIIADSPIEHAKAVGELMEREMLAESKLVVGDTLIFEAEPEYGFTWAEAMNPSEWDKWLQENYKVSVPTA
jgi:DNA polymerase I-like protein with 3'-5' exonuclease and polymerase domains